MSMVINRPEPMAQAWLEGGAGGTADPNEDPNISPDEGDPNGDNEGSGASGPPLQNKVAELDRKLANVTEALEKATNTIQTLSTAKPATPEVDPEDLKLLTKLKGAFSSDSEEADPIAALGPPPDLYVDGTEKYQEWMDKRTALLVSRGVQSGITEAQRSQSVKEGSTNFSRDNLTAEENFKSTFKNRTGREITKEELDDLASFVNESISPSGRVHPTNNGNRRAYTEADIWKGFKLKNHDKIVGEVASKSQSDAAKALRDVSSVPGSSAGPADATDFDQMTAMDQAVVLKQLNDAARFREAKPLIDDLRAKNPARLREVRQILENAEARAKDPGFGGGRDW